VAGFQPALLSYANRTGDCEGFSDLGRPRAQVETCYSTHKLCIIFVMLKTLTHLHFPKHIFIRIYPN
ncbi:MAG: hypothetical protein PHI66_00500, partial [Candidatus Pacebacteria bacterium]|nr:hypothetical protein [Candidatus Paceibacterota bacterium]